MNVYGISLCMHAETEEETLDICKFSLALALKEKVCRCSWAAKTIINLTTLRNFIIDALLISSELKCYIIALIKKGVLRSLLHVIYLK